MNSVTSAASDRHGTPVRPGRKRDNRADRAIVDATADLLAELGYDRLTMEAVAARAGVAKTTLYRRWPSKAVLVADAFAIRAERHLPVPDSGELAVDLHRYLVAVAERLASPTGRAMLGTVAAGIRVPELAELLRERFVASRRAAIAGLLRRGIDAGQADPDLDVDLAVDLLVAPLYYRRLVSGQPTDEPFVARLVASMGPVVAPGLPWLL